MVHKRYIKKHGKRLGPYYYHNVRGEDGKVKSVYIGKRNPKQKKIFDKRFVLSLFIGLLILSGAYFLITNNDPVLGKRTEEKNVPFDIDQIMIKTLLKSKEYMISPLRIMNIGINETRINIDIKGIEYLVGVSEKNFIIKPGQTKIIYLNFSSSLPEDSIEYKPDVYVGKLIATSGGYKKEIPIIIEIESKDVLFDMNLNVPPQDREVKQGKEAIIEVRLFNLKGIDPVNIGMEYFVKDLNGNTIITESETVVVTTQASFFKTIKIPANLKEGGYIFAARAEYATSVGTASYLFDVLAPVEEKRSIEFTKICKEDALCWLSVFAALVMIFSIGAYVYFLVGAWFFSRFYGKSEIRAKEKAPGKGIAKAYKKIVFWLVLLLITILLAIIVYHSIQKIGIESLKGSLKTISKVYIYYAFAVVISSAVLVYAYRKKGKIKYFLRKIGFYKTKKDRENEKEKRRKERLEEEKENRLIEEIKNEDKKRIVFINQIINRLSNNINDIEKNKIILKHDEERLANLERNEISKIKEEIKTEISYKKEVSELNKQISHYKRLVSLGQTNLISKIDELTKLHNQYQNKAETLRRDILERTKYAKKLIKKREDERAEEKIAEAKRKKEEERKKRFETRKKVEIRKTRIKEFLHSVGLYKTEAEKKEIRKDREMMRERKGKEKLIEEEKRKRELENQRREKEIENQKKEDERLRERRKRELENQRREKELLREKKQREKEEKKSKKKEETLRKKGETKRGLKKGDVREKLNRFNALLKNIDNNIKNKKIKEAAGLYADLKNEYNEIMKMDIGQQGKIILYNKINDAYKQLKSARKP